MIYRPRPTGWIIAFLAITVIVAALFLRLRSRIADETRFTRALGDLQQLDKTGPSTIPIDPWGNRYLLVEAVSGNEVFRYHYSTGPDGRSGTMGHDPDDIGPNTDLTIWLDHLHPDRVTTPLVWSCSLFLAGVIGSGFHYRNVTGANPP